MKKAVCVFLLSIGCSVVSNAQLNNTFLSDKIVVTSKDSNTWGFSVSNFNYLRNTEYFNVIESGRTLFGYQLHPQLFVQPFERVRLQAGVFVQSDFGATPVINKVLPTFTIKFLSKNQTESFTFGTLEGALAHRLIEPLWDINSAIERRIENGAQFKSERNKLFVDAWINWEQFIERGSPYKEQFTSGLNFTPTLFKSAKGLFINTPLQATAFHRGGQIDSDTSNMIMQVNAALGLQIGNQEVNNAWKWQTELYYTHYQENSNSGYFPYRNGNGLFANAAITRNHFTLMGSYWQGSQWMAPRGTVLYQSVSIDKPGVVEANRQLFFLRLLYAKELRKSLTLSARVEPVYDVKASLLDFSYSLYISYRLDKVIGRIN
ncbi:MAG: hypothetical protein MUE96_04830 [Bacteroidia bacterium]|jgi:hypothetical protein|nr:hypothetical protein [Bacteroidia bacterium]